MLTNSKKQSFKNL